MKLTFPLQSNIDIPRNIFRAGAVVQYNGFLRMCDGTTLTHHGRASLSLIYITSESSILIGFHTILWSKFNIKIRLQISLVLKLSRSGLGDISSLSATRYSAPRHLLHVTQSPQEWWYTTRYSVSTGVVSATRYSVSTGVVVYYTLLSLHRSGGLLHVTQSPQE